MARSSLQRQLVRSRDRRNDVLLCPRGSRFPLADKDYTIGYAAKVAGTRGVSHMRSNSACHLPLKRPRQEHAALAVTQPNSDSLHHRARAISARVSVT